MHGTQAADLALLAFRVGVGIVFLAHGYNHIFRGGRIAGTARWFENLGMRIDVPAQLCLGCLPVCPIDRKADRAAPGARHFP